MSSDTPSPSSLLMKPQRVLACVLCQQRKVKCDRKFPCANCIKSRAQCVPATLSKRRRRRKFPEQELLDRLRKYEDLMRQNDVSFEPLHQPSTENQNNIDAKSDGDSDAQNLETVTPDSTAVKSERRSVWHTISRGFRDPENDSESSYDDVRETAVKTAWDQTVPKDDNLLFGSRDTTVEISTLHPDPVQIFRLWQIYLDNVNPLLKITHTPTLQPRIIEAASNLASIKPTLEALMFAIYCMSLTSLDAQDCQTMFGASKEDLLTRYQFGCQQALYNCGFLRTSDVECLTALYLYLISVMPNTVPQALYTMLGVAIRIAQRMGIQSESIVAKYSVIDAEIRRRLWWSIVLFDYRISEISGSTVTSLDPTWDCRVPLNVNDSDLRPDMKEPPAIQGTSSEALFAVVRGEFGEYIRHTAGFLEFTNPALKFMVKRPQSGSAEGSEMEQLERVIENRYLKFCVEENPIHYMTIWLMRAYLAKHRLVEHHVNYDGTSASQTDAQRDTATALAIRMLESDTKIMTSSATKGFRWMNRLYFPFPAYLQICQDLKIRPTMKQAPSMWGVLSDNYDAWFGSQGTEIIGPIYQLYTRVILHAWEACEAAYKQSGTTLRPPKVVMSIRTTLSGRPKHAQSDDVEYPNSNMDMGVDGSSMQMPAYLANQPLLYTNEMQDGFAGTMTYPGILEQDPLAGYMDQYDWTAFLGRPNWPGF